MLSTSSMQQTPAPFEEPQQRVPILPNPDTDTSHATTIVPTHTRDSIAPAPPRPEGVITSTSTRPEQPRVVAYPIPTTAEPIAKVFGKIFEHHIPNIFQCPQIPSREHLNLGISQLLVILRAKTHLTQHETMHGLDLLHRFLAASALPDPKRQNHPVQAVPPNTAGMVFATIMMLVLKWTRDGKWDLNKYATLFGQPGKNIISTEAIILRVLGFQISCNDAVLKELHDKFNPILPPDGFSQF